MSSDKKLARNTESLNQCTPIYKIEEKEAPTVVANRLKLFKTNTAAKRPTANERTFDLFPNLIPMMTEIMLTSLEFASALGAEMSGHSKISTATICFYQVFVLYSYFLINDAYVRPSPSNAAKTWLQSSSRTRLLNFAKRLPVPHWMLTIFQQWSATSSNNNGNVFIVPSAASVRLETHFGKFFPANFFSSLHDLAATLPGNSDPTVVFSKLFYTLLSTVQIQGHTTARTHLLMIHELLGFSPDADRQVHTYINSRVYQAFDSVFNPVLFRDQQRRKTFAKLNLMPTEFSTIDEFNIYDLLLCFNEQNDSELYVILETVATALDAPASFTKTLGQAIATRSGIQIFDHGYSAYLLPTHITTYVANKKKGPADVKKFEMELISNKDRATALTFLQPIAALTSNPTTDARILVNMAEHKSGTPAKGTDFVHLDDSAAINDALVKSSVTTSPLHLGPLTASKSGKENSSVLTTVEFDQKLHVAPEYQILDVSGDAEETAWLIGLSGKIIETFEIDGTTVAHPDPLQNTATQNHQQGESLIPVRYAYYATQFHARDATTSLYPPRARADNVSDDRVICSTHLVDRTTVAIPRATQHVRDAAIPASFPGLSTIVNVNWISKFQYFLGFRAADRMNKEEDDDKVPSMERHHLYVFSPYMYSGYEDHKSTSFRQSVNRTYWVTNLRSHFGSDTPLLKAEHPYKAHPLV